MTSPGATVTSRKSSPAYMFPSHALPAVLEARDEALDAEPAVAADPDAAADVAAGQDALLGGPLGIEPRRCDPEPAARPAVVVDDPAGCR